MPLYHFSEDPTITCFVPRSPLARPEVEPMVWTIDEWHAPVYYVPRDCPRVCFWPLPTTTPEDRDRLWSTVSARLVIAIEFAWYERLRTTALYRYTMPEETFELLEKTTDQGAYISRSTIIPLRVEPMGDLMERLRESDVELRLCPSLVPIGEAVIRSTLHFSLYRMRNAQGWTVR